MKRTSSKKLEVSKVKTSEGVKYVVSVVGTNKELYHVMDLPISSRFDFRHPLLSGVGSVLNISGNNYSFDQYLRTSDAEAISSDWNNVGMAFLDVMSSNK